MHLDGGNGGTINIVGDDCFSIDIAYTDKPEIAEEKFLPTELDGCYVTLSSLSIWAKECTDEWSENEEYRTIFNKTKNIPQTRSAKGFAGGFIAFLFVQYQ
ncbi:MAG: hypothetical protein RR063_08310 [Anaerovoracaceae bacterium]